MNSFNSIKKPTYFYLPDGKIVINYMYGWPKQPHSNITKINYIFPDYDKKRNYSNKKYSVTEKDRIESIKHTAKVYELTYLKEKKEKEIASLKYDMNKYSISRIAELEKDIEDIENSIIFHKNSIHPYFYNTQTTIYPHQQEVISDILSEIAHITQAKFVASNPEFDADIKFGFYDDFHISHGSIEFSYTTRGFATYPSRYSTPIKKINIDEQYQYSGTIFLNLSSHQYYKIIHQHDLDNYIKTEGNIGDAFNFKDNGTVLIIKKTNTLIETLKNNKYQPGTYHYKVILHEVGHALGLNHSWQYLEYKDKNHVLASLKYSVMGYDIPTSEHADFGGLYPMTFMLLDILLLQYLYGPNMTTRLENNIYGFHSNTGRAAYSLKSIEDKLVSCIWDSGGIDTLDFSLYTVNQVINLNEGCFSDIGGLRSNISIAYKTIIENAIGGSGHDTIIGNSANNELLGGDGNDTIDGGLGNDHLYGGMGNDILYGDIGNDLLFSISKAGHNELQGGEGNDIFYCGLGTNLLYGEQGNDTFNFLCHKGAKSYNLIFDFNTNEDKIIFVDQNYKKIDISKMKRVEQLSGNENEIVLHNDIHTNKTTITISTANNDHHSTIFIKLEGILSYNDLLDM
ncbi:M10 family metallopeptidase [Proteus mirabilis]|nr:M10 family metallopeptidase [Proteus mirabilis]EKU7264544.1 M10 family metallopeptidase [Proteus mirabilis]ELB1134314.1 M10 family metallopeptidase [Proteus mirabilis]MBG2788761.1 M10 family metallopeptidase [Proteus mirabilis]MCS4548899.1 M10 family metallopeptidase C-terminal domain-containing protein [Proteus mirabilis]